MKQKLEKERLEFENKERIQLKRRRDIQRMQLERQKDLKNKQRIQFEKQKEIQNSIIFDGSSVTFNGVKTYLKMTQYNFGCFTIIIGS